MDLSAFWIILTGALAAGACGLLGSYLVLRKMSLLGDAISHAVLPGIAIAFILTSDRNTIPMLIGASALGLTAAFMIEFVHKKWKVPEDASIGIIFTALFAIGVILISAYIGHVDIDQECVLYGEIAYTPWDTVILSGKEIGPRPVWMLGFVFLIDLGLVILLYKELKIASFDPSMAVSLGISASLIHYILMTAVSLTTVAAFESVGAILVVAMLIVPGATAYLLTDRLNIMLFISVGVGFLSSIIGYWLAGLWDSSIAGAIAVAAGGQFALAFIFSPKHGVLVKAYHQISLNVQHTADHMLLALTRQTESGDKGRMTIKNINQMSATSPLFVRIAYLINKKAGFLFLEGVQIKLTAKGVRMSEKLLGGHRLWEAFLSERMGLPIDHTHAAAHDMEHYINDELREKIRISLKNSQKDPHGKTIPN